MIGEVTAGPYRESGILVVPLAAASGNDDFGFGIAIHVFDFQGIDPEGNGELRKRFDGRFRDDSFGVLFEDPDIGEVFGEVLVYVFPEETAPNDFLFSAVGVDNAFLFLAQDDGLGGG
jgi:hypothetical protein